MLELHPNTIKHIESSSDEEMSAQEKKQGELQEQIQNGLTIASGGDPTSQVEPRAALADIKSTYAILLKLSRLGTNNRSTTMSLTESIVIGNECTKRVGELDELLAKEATAGRNLSETAYKSGLWWILAVAIAGVVLGGLVATIVTRSITGPVSEVRNLAQTMAKGDLRQRIQLRRQDEAGQLSDATNALADSLTRIVTEIQKVSDGLAGSPSELSGVSNQLLQQSEHASLKATSVATASEQLSSNISTMAAAAEEMSVNVASISGCSFSFRRRHLPRGGRRHHPHRNGMRRRQGSRGAQAQRRIRDCTGRGVQRSLGNARRSGCHQPGRRGFAAGTHRPDSCLVAGAQDDAMQLTPAAFNEIRKAVQDLCGVVIAEDKQYLVKSRLEPILRSNGLSSYDLLVERLKQPNSLPWQDQLVEAITTKETSFNRDGHPFEELRRSILSQLAGQLLEQKATTGLSYPKARIWCAAVATGQEAYSVAMAVTDFLAARSAGGLTVDEFPILATDISANALAVARDGRYSTAELGRGLTTELRDRFLRQENGAWIVAASLRRMVEFRRLNLMQPLRDLGTFDLIMCRNLLIYLDQEARRRLCQALHSALNPQGILLIGAAESLYEVTDSFSAECLGNTVVYRKQ